jgi:pimeloyl-ACP methyl ester carboxylesterase
LWSVFERPYRVPHERFQVTTEDGIRLAGVHLRDKHPTLAIYCHGLMSSKNHRTVPGFVEALGEAFDVMAFDFRGHGESGGCCTFTDREVLDLKAVANYAHTLGYERLIAIDSSMGGATVIRYAALYGGLRGIVTIGAFADARSLAFIPARVTLNFFFGTPIGRNVVELWRGTRLGDMNTVAQPIDLVGQIDPSVALLVIHGEFDPLIAQAQGEALIERARGSKEMIVVPRGSHDIPLLNTCTRDLIVGWARRQHLLNGGLDVR